MFEITDQNDEDKDDREPEDWFDEGGQGVQPHVGIDKGLAAADPQDDPQHPDLGSVA